MKTFLWTTLFWILVVIAGLLCLGFGNLGTQVLDNSRLVRFMPNNVQTKICEPILSQSLEWIDRCAVAQENGCYADADQTDSNSEIEITDSSSETLPASLDDVVANQVTIYNQMNEWFTTLQQMIASLAAPIPVDETNAQKEQQKRELQAQIEALQSQMANL